MTGGAFGDQRNLSRTGRGLRVHEDAEGRIDVIARSRSTPFIGFFPVNLQGSSNATVGPGAIQSITPRLGGVRLDGTDPSGASGLTVPPLDISAGGNSDFRSWVVIHTQVDPKLGTLDQSKNPNAAVIEHLLDYPSKLTNGVCVDDGHGNGYFALAMIVWQTDNTPVRVIQNSFFNRGYSFKPAAQAGKGWHLFPPVA